MGVAHIGFLWKGEGLLIRYMFLHTRHLIDATSQPEFKIDICLAFTRSETNYTLNICENNLLLISKWFLWAMSIVLIPKHRIILNATKAMDNVEQNDFMIKTSSYLYSVLRTILTRVGITNLRLRRILQNPAILTHHHHHNHHHSIWRWIFSNWNGVVK